MLQSCIIYDGSPTALTYRAEKVRSEDVLRVAKEEACLTHRGIAYHHDLQESIKRFHDADLAKHAIVSSRSQAVVRIAVQQNVLQLPFCFHAPPVHFPFLFSSTTTLQAATAAKQGRESKLVCRI